MSEAVQLVALAGESIVCPDCGETLLAFERDVHASDADTFKALTAQACTSGVTLCRFCGAQWGLKIEGLPLWRVYIRSGSWAGWRRIGGE